jgi:hypothetical protein
LLLNKVNGVGVRVPPVIINLTTITNKTAVTDPRGHRGRSVVRDGTVVVLSRHFLVRSRFHAGQVRLGQCSNIASDPFIAGGVAIAWGVAIGDRGWSFHGALSLFVFLYAGERGLVVSDTAAAGVRWVWFYVLLRV